MDKLKLKKPIKVNGNEITDLPYDFEDLTAKDKLAAGKKFKTAGFSGSLQELDPDYHFFIFVEAVAKADNSITEQDLNRLSLQDTVTASSLVRNFFFLNSEDLSPTNTSEEQSLK